MLTPKKIFMVLSCIVYVRYLINLKRWVILMGVVEAIYEEKV